MAIPRIKCNCPDSTGQRGSIPGSSTPSQMVATDWTNDFSGISSLIPGGKCKHEIRVIIKLGLMKEFGIPTDLPTNPTVGVNGKKDNSPRLNRNPALGDDFSSP